MNSAITKIDSNDEPSKPASPVLRLIRLIGFLGVVVFSLLTFPAGLSVLLGCWIAAFGFLQMKNQTRWYCLIVPMVVILVKRTFWPPSLYCLLSLMTLIGIWELWRPSLSPRLNPPRLQKSIGSIVLLLAWIWFYQEWQSGTHRSLKLSVWPKDRPVVCVGDSLTSGVAPFGGYSVPLSELLSVPVLNLGREGVTAKSVADDLLQMQAARPLAVVIELGGHDFLKGYNRQATKESLEKIISVAQKAGAEVFLVEVPRGFITDPYQGLEREIAREQDIELISDGIIRSLVLRSPIAPPGMWNWGEHFSEDGLHPNHAGNRFIAQEVAKHLEQRFGRNISAKKTAPF